MEILYRNFIGINASMNVGMIAGIGLQCRRDNGRGARTDACGRSFAVLSTHVSTVGLRLDRRVAACLK